MQIKKPDFKNIGRRKKAGTETSELDISKGVVFGASAPSAPSVSFGAEDSTDSFGVNVRNEAAGIKLLDEKAAGSSWWMRELSHEIATALALMSFFAFALAAAGLPGTIPFCLAGVAVYTLLVVLEEMTEVRVKLLAAAGITVALVVLVIVLRKFIGGGLGSIMNNVYEASEAVQAYVYNKFPISEAAQSNPGTAVKAAAVWVSCLAGALGAIPPAAVRRGIGLGVAAFAFIAFAYYGLVPSAIVIALAVAVIMFVLARGGILSALPVLMVSMLLLGAVMLINPGENYGISGADENMRDRLALRSAYLQSNLEQDSYTDSNDPFSEDTEYETENDDYTNTPKWVVPLIIISLVIAAIAGAGYLLYRRYTKKRDANRKGIDSEDLRTAIIAMFPYAVRWLGASGLEVSGKSFASLIEPLRGNISEQYSNYFRSMYILWREAAYSDHEMAEEKRAAMKEFMDETRAMVEKDLDWRGKLKTTLKYAL